MSDFPNDVQKPLFSFIFWSPEGQNWAKTAQNQISSEDKAKSVHTKLEVGWMISFADNSKKPPFSVILATSGTKVASPWQGSQQF